MNEYDHLIYCIKEDSLNDNPYAVDVGAVYCAILAGFFLSLLMWGLS